METTQTTSVYLPQKLPPHGYYDHFTPENNQATEDRQCAAFVGYLDERHERHVIIKHPAEKKFIKRRAIQSTRYSESGRERIKRKIRDCLGSYKTEHGILVTLTYADPDNKSGCYEGLARPDAWQGTGYRPRDWFDEVNKYRKRHGSGRVKRRIRVLEIQADRLYPHVHIWYPGLHFLAPTKVLQKLWPYGNVDIKKVWRDSPADYITKYISKMDGQDFMQAMTWGYNLRMYSTSRDYKFIHKDRPLSGWRFHSSGGKYTAEENVRQLIEEGYSEIGTPLIYPRGS